MKKNYLFIFTAIMILALTSCSTNPTPSQNNKITNGERLSMDIDAQENFESKRNTSVKLPTGGNYVSGELISNQDLNNTSNESKSNTTLEADNSESNTINKEYSTANKYELLSTYSSKVYTKTEDRQKNLRIVCEKLTGIILAPNEEFSYNTTCGPYNKENGFGKATVFLGDGTETQDYGGGVCQLSSTLYNAVKNLNVEITERHKHSKKVYYVPDGQDATVSYGNLDFKFKNLNNYSLFFEATSNAETVKVNVYKV